MIINKLLIRKKFRKNNTIVKTINLEKDLVLGMHCHISKRVALSHNVIIGDFTYLNAGKEWITIESNSKIGKFCSIAPGVHIGAGNHDYSFVTTHPILFDKYYERNLQSGSFQKVNGLKDKDKETIIGNDVWIGLRAIIGRGVKIGNGVVIGAGSIVTKDVPDYAIVAGNPAKIIKYRTTKDNIDLMMSNSNKMWYNWNISKIIQNADDLYDFDNYVKKYFEK